MSQLDSRPRDCPLCGEGGRPQLFSDVKIDEARLDEYAFASRKRPEYMHHRLMLCRRCDVVYADPAPTPEALARAYHDASFDSQNEARLAAKTYAHLVDRIAGRLPGRSGVLDIGTGDGSFLAELLERGFTDVSGVEPSAEPIARASPGVRPLIRHEVFAANTRAPGSLSLVTCFQTVEHLYDPLEVCGEAFRLLRPGGALLLVVHNRRALSARVLRERSPIFDVEHLQLFSPAAAHRLMRRAGFSSVAVRPVINRYPATYWMRLFPLPAQVKRGMTALAGRAGLDRLNIPLAAGNMSIVGFRTS